MNKTDVARLVLFIGATALIFIGIFLTSSEFVRLASHISKDGMLKNLNQSGMTTITRTYFSHSSRPSAVAVRNMRLGGRSLLTIRPANVRFVASADGNTSSCFVHSVVRAFWRSPRSPRYARVSSCRPSGFPSSRIPRCGL